MRILQVIETGGPGGAETVCAQLASGLAARGHSVHCLVGSGNWLPDELRRRGFAPSLISNGGRGSLDLRLLHQLVSLIRENDIELVHAHLFDGAVYATIAARICGRPSITTLHGQVDVKKRGMATRAKCLILRGGASAVVTVSNSLMEDLADVLRIPQEIRHVIYNGVDGTPTQRFADSRATGERTGDCFRLIAIGNIRPAKEYPSLLHALAILRERGVSIHLDILGQPDEEGLFLSLTDQVEQQGLRSVVSFHGFVGDPRPYLACADAFVLASSREGFSLATIEAMLAGIPVVATRSGGPEEILSDGVTGLLVPAGNPEALADSIMRLAEDRVLSGRLATAAAASARSRFSLAAMIEAYESLYKQVVDPMRLPSRS